MKPIPTSSARSGTTGTRAEYDEDLCPHERVHGFVSDLGWAACIDCGGTIAPQVFKRSAGRPSLFTVDAQERIVEGVGQGEYPATAAAAAGITGSALRVWLESNDPVFRPFQIRVRQARGEFRARMERLVAVSKPEYWLKNAGRYSVAPEEFPEDKWSDAKQVEGTMRHAHVHAHVQAQAAEIDYSKLTREQLDALEAAHLAVKEPEPEVRAALPEPATEHVIDVDTDDDE